MNGIGAESIAGLRVEQRHLDAPLASLQEYGLDDRARTLLERYCGLYVKDVICWSPGDLKAVPWVGVKYVDMLTHVVLAFLRDTQ
jgi:hypothetical protein